MAPYSIAVIGVGKIAQDQHLPVIAGNADFRLAAVVSGRGLAVDGVPTFRTAAELYAALPDIEAVAICTPPGVRHALAREALDAGLHVLLEKPPFPTTRELVDIGDRAARAGRVIFTTWHSQYNAAVDETRRRLAGRKLRSLAITWKEDVRRWHPGQDWIWEAGGFGVFDPGCSPGAKASSTPRHSSSSPMPSWWAGGRTPTPSRRSDRLRRCEARVAGVRQTC